jgi:dTDP-4-amino-4,6-dideoxygalactose transaminase
MINVTKAFLPPIEEYKKYLDGIWDRVHLTNNGPLVIELEEKLTEYLGVPYFYFLNNGTIALQLAIKALDLKGEIITTPFSYVATTSSIVWENATPVFVDIDSETLTLDPKKIEEAITPLTSAILATHVYGIPCHVEEISKIAAKRNLKVIYDAAHAFGVKFRGKSILNYGDVSTLSFHATKLFHTIEGGGVTVNDSEVSHKISFMRNFGHKGQEEYWGLGINGKNSEFHAAMGLVNFRYVNEILQNRKELSDAYSKCFEELNVSLQRPIIPHEVEYNYSYYPIIFESERQLLAVKDALNANYIYPRRYFYPSLDTLPYVSKRHNLAISKDVSPRVMCLPLYYGLSVSSIKSISGIISKIITRW